jgi:hypothetical protein
VIGKQPQEIERSKVVDIRKLDSEQGVYNSEGSEEAPQEEERNHES